MQKELMSFGSSARKDALFWLEESGSRAKQCKDVLRIFLGCVENGATDEEVSLVLGIKVTSVIARRHDLIKKFPNLFYVDCKRLAPSNVLVDVWRCRV